MALRYFELFWLVQERKNLCSQFFTIDSFALFRDKEAIEWCKGKVVHEIPVYDFKATLLDTRYEVEYNNGSYTILFEKQACNFGGYRYFFHCPKCDRRMRILYCDAGKFLCRKCLNLGYFTQRLGPEKRWFAMADKIKNKLVSIGGSLDRKPPWTKKKTFEKLKRKHREYSQINFDKAWLRKLFKGISDEELKLYL